MIDRRHIENIDWFLIILLVLISLVGVLAVYSSSHYLPGKYYLKQMLFIGVSLVLLFLFLAVDYTVLTTYSFYFYSLIAAVLAGMLLFGQITARESWIKLRYFQVQPSELAKIALILVLAQMFSEYKKNYVSLGAVMASSGLTAAFSILVASQPDLGTAVSYLPLLLGALILAGLKRRALALILIFSVLLGVAGWNLVLKDYQKKRLTTLIFPGMDPRGSGYQILQSKIAIGSGGFSGKGFKKGTQSQLRFLPARHTDFILSVVGEEFGFLGVTGVLILYFLFIARLFSSCAKSRDRTGVYIIFIVSMMFSFQVLVNVAMVIGLFPIVGIPLPLLSYGGSSLLTSFLAVSLVVNIKMRRFVNI